MRGSISSQMGRLGVEVNSIGESKYDDKQEARETLSEMGLPATSENIAELTGIHSAGTMTDYMEKWQTLGEYAKSEFGVKNMEQLSPEIVKSFLADKIEAGVAYSTYSGYCCAIGKLENALEGFTKEVRGEDKDFGFRTAISELRAEAREELSRFTGTRNYEDPSRLVSSLSGVSSLVSRIQLESGARVAEASRVSAGQLRGLTTDKMTGKEIGQYDFTGKGGKLNTANLSPATYQDLVRHIEQHGSLNASPDTYRNDLKTASTSSGQDYNGSHGLRWCFAQERYAELRENGIGHVRALGQVSAEMGHNRIVITEHYLAK